MSLSFGKDLEWKSGAFQKSQKDLECLLTILCHPFWQDAFGTCAADRFSQNKSLFLLIFWSEGLLRAKTLRMWGKSVQDGP